MVEGDTSVVVDARKPAVLTGEETGGGESWSTARGNKNSHGVVSTRADVWFSISVRTMLFMQEGACL